MPGLRRLLLTGLAATLVAMVVTTLVATLARTVGVGFEIPDGGKAIPLAGFATMTGFGCLLGTVIAVALLRWSTHPADRFVWTAGTLTALSLLPPLLAGADAATAAALVALHLLAGAVVVPALAHGLRDPTPVEVATSQPALRR